MGERQEKVWVVSKCRIGTAAIWPVKVFDDRSDARAYAKIYNKVARKFKYLVDGVPKG